MRKNRSAARWLPKGGVLLAAFWFVVAGVAFAQPRAVHPALYAVRDADSTIYLFGTIHVRPRGAAWSNLAIDQALTSASDVWTETEISPAAEAQAQNLIASLGRAAPGHPLSSYLNGAQQQRLNALLVRLGVAPSVLEQTQPWLASVMLSMAPVTQAGFDPESGVDRSVDAVAEAAHKRMHAFETTEQQLRFLSGLSADAQQQMLLDAIDEAEDAPSELREMSVAWERGDEAALERLVLADVIGKYPELYDVIFRRRNAAWIETLSREMQGSGVAFVAVGAGHLIGRDGLVAQLRAHGFRVDRVRD